MTDESIDTSAATASEVSAATTIGRSAHDAGRLRKNIAALSILQLLNYTLPLAVVPYLTRILGPAHYGLLIFAQATANYAVSVTDYGFNFSATRLIARSRSDSDELSRIFWSTLIAKSLLMLLCLIVLTALIAFIPTFQAHAPLFFATFLMVFGSVLFPMWFFQGIEDMKTITIAHSIAKLSLIPLYFLFVTDQTHIVRAAAIQSGTYVLAGVIGIPLILRKSLIRWHRPSWAELIETYKEGWHVFLSSAAIFVYTSTNALVLGFASGTVQVGFFGAADRIIKASQNLQLPVTQALYPHLNSVAVESRDAAVALIKKSLVWIFLATLAVSIVLFVGAVPICHILFGEKFIGSIVPLRWMAPLPVIIGLSNVFGVQTMLTFGLNKEFNRVVTSSVVINLLLTVLFAKLWGAVGAAVALLITELFVTAAMIAIVQSKGLLKTSVSSDKTT